MYVPTSLSPSFAVIVVASTGCPSTKNFAGLVVLIVNGTVFSTGFSVVPTFALPALNTGVPSCVAPWIPSEFAFSPVGVTGMISGLYVAFEVIVAVSSFSFLTVTVACTSIAGTSPV